MKPQINVYHNLPDSFGQVVHIHQKHPRPANRAEHMGTGQGWRGGPGIGFCASAIPFTGWTGHYDRVE